MLGEDKNELKETSVEGGQHSRVLVKKKSRFGAGPAYRGMQGYPAKESFQHASAKKNEQKKGGRGHRLYGGGGRRKSALERGSEGR